MKHIILAIALCFGAFWSPGLIAQGQKIGFVISPKIFQELPEALAAQREYEALERSLQDSLTVKAQSIQLKIDEFQKKEAMMNDAAKRTATQEIQDMQRRAADWSDLKRQELLRKQEDIFAPIREKQDMSK